MTCCAIAVVLALTGLAQEGPQDPRTPVGAAGVQDGTDSAQLGWPREKEIAGAKVVMYQPQVESWQRYAELEFLAAVAVTPKGETEPLWGALTVRADTDTSFTARTVLIDDLEITKADFPKVDDTARLARGQAALQSLMTGKSFEISLDRLLAEVERGRVLQREVRANTDPPRIFRSERPAVLLQFIGPPEFEAIEGTNLLFATNTNWDVFLETGSPRYYLLDESGWLTTEDWKRGPWKATGKVPRDLRKLPNDGNWDVVKNSLPARASIKVPVVFTTERPSELIVTNGAPKFIPIVGTELLYAANTDSDLFLHSGEKRHYLLLAGRWFRATSIDGPWSAARTSLPDDFAKIPGDHPRERVLASVPGTPDAEEAAVLASIPRKATVKRSDTKVDVAYEGDPQFVAINGTDVRYAVNTPNAVFQVGELYYCCHSGVWFVGVQPTGPWVVCDDVPQVIYTIPASHPMHHVTYVYVYDSTPDTVVVGYTSGYTGSYVVSGVVMFGVGYWLGHESHHHHHAHWHHYHYHPCHYSYGCGAWYDHHSGTYQRADRHYGPYGGAGRGAVYNPHTGGWARGGYAYGPRGGAFAAEGYNPYTGRYGATAQRSTPYGSFGRSVVATDDGWARTGHRSGPGGRTTVVRTSEGAGAVRRTSGRSGLSVAKDKNNNVYVGKDGQVYRRDGSGSWEQRSKNGWQSATRDRTGTGDGRPTGPRTGNPTRPGTGTTRPRTTNPRTTTPSRGSRSTGSVRGGLERSSRSRQRGTSRTSRFGGSRSRGSAGRSRSGGRSGGGRRR